VSEREPLPVFANPSAGLWGVGHTEDDITAALEAAGYPVAVCAVDPAALARAVADAARDGAEVVGVCGGDGTLHTAAGALAGGDTALLPLPTGTLNHFARRLGIATPAAAAAALRDGRTERVAVGVMDDRLFLNTATFGVYADVVRRRDRLRRWLGKWPAAAVGFLVNFVRPHPLDVVLEVEGEELHRTTPLVWVGVGVGSFPAVHEAPGGTRAAALEIVVVRPGSRLGIVALLARLLVRMLRGGRPADVAGLEVLHARRLLIRSHHRVGITLDGEVLREHAPLFVGLVDRALRVVVPASAAAAATTAS
jgi:undecaprenyl-diphosphatase